MGLSGRRKQSIKITNNFNTALAVGAEVAAATTDIMPDQVGRKSAEELDDDEGRTKEIPRQSVLSNLVESSISNFENESGEEGAGDEEVEMARLDEVIATKNNIKIEKQASINQTKPINNLKSRKSQKAAKRKKEPVLVNNSAVTSGNEDKPERNSSIHRKDIDSDNKSELSDDSNGARIEKLGGRTSSMMRRKKN